jgi:NAD(P)-dependent dehydrogenase (short-subunit alcohol dehydrogenase family)
MGVKVKEEKGMDLEKLTKGWDFAARTVLIPGGAGVLGSEMACALVKCGANVVILDRDLSRADSLKVRLMAGPGSGKFAQADVLSKESLLKARDMIKAEFGKVHALINAAGGNMPAATTGPERSFFDLPEEAIKLVVDLNLVGSILPSQIFGRMMADQGEGVIINISSMSAYRPLTRTIGYSASKAAVTNFTQWLAVHMAHEYSPRIRVNAIAPGFFHTSQNHYLLYDEKTGALTPRGKTIIDHTPMRRFGIPEDLLGALLWLLSPASEFVTGAVIPIDGGFSAFSGV